MRRHSILVCHTIFLQFAAAAHADLHLQVIQEENTLGSDIWTDRIVLAGSDPGTSLVSISGAAASPMILETTLATQFFNIDSVGVFFDGQSPFIPDPFVTTLDPHAPFDTGLIAFAGHDDPVSDGFTDEFGAFAFADGMSAMSENVSVGDLTAPIPFDSNGEIDLLRITWPWIVDGEFNYMTFSTVVTIDLGPLAGTEQHYLTVTHGWVPAPGALAMLGFAGLVGGIRNRSRHS